MSYFVEIKPSKRIEMPVTLRSVKAAADRKLHKYIKSRWVISPESKEKTTYEVSVNNGITRDLNTRRGYRNFNLGLFRLTPRTNRLTQVDSPRFRRRRMNEDISRQRRDLATNLQVRVANSKSLKDIIEQCIYTIVLNNSIQRGGSFNNKLQEILHKAVRGYVYEQLMRYINSRCEIDAEENNYNLTWMSKLLRDQEICSSRLELAFECRKNINISADLGDVMQILRDAERNNDGRGHSRYKSQLGKTLNHLIKFIGRVHRLNQQNVRQSTIHRLQRSAAGLFRRGVNMAEVLVEEADDFLDGITL